MVETVQGERAAERDLESRWAGGALAASVSTLVVTTSLYGFVLGSPTPATPGAAITVADRALHVANNWGLASGLWLAETLAYVVIAVAAFALQGGRGGGPSWLPRRVAWSAVGVGALLQSVMYAFMLGGYPSAIEVVESSPELFSALGDAAYFLFYAGNAALLFGLAGAFWAEGPPVRLLPTWLSRTGFAVCLTGMLVLLALMAGMGSLVLAAPFALIGFALTAYLGVAIFRHS